MAMANVKKNSVETMMNALTDNNRNYWNSYSATLSEGTRKVYQSDILNYLVWINKDITETSVVEFEKFVVTLQENGLGGKAINKKLSALRSMNKYLVAQGIMSVDPLADAKRVDETEPVMERNILSWVQVQQCKDLDGMKFDIFNSVYSKGLSLEDAAHDAGITVNQFKYNIKKLGEEIGIPTLKYMDLIDTRNQFHTSCPCCNNKVEMSDGNWKFANGLMICKDC